MPENQDDFEEKNQILSAISEGNCYLLKEKDAEKVYSLFSKELAKDFKGICITRTRPEIIKEKYGLTNEEILFLTSQKAGKKELEDLDKLYKKIEDFLKKNKKAKILLDRLDYLISMYGFEEVIKFLYNLNDSVMKKKAIVLTHVNPQTLTQQQLSLLAEELGELKLPDFSKDSELSEDLTEIIEFLQKEGKSTFKNIGRQFGITKTTTRNRINKLVKYGIVEVKKNGRNKVVKLCQNIP